MRARTAGAGEDCGAWVSAPGATAWTCGRCCAATCPKRSSSPSPTRRALLRAVLGGLLTLLAAGCDSKWEVRQRIDHDWYRQTLIDVHLSHWLRAAPSANGFFRTAVDRNWNPLERQPGDLVSHARMLYVLAAGFEVTGERTYLEQVRLGAEFMLAHFRDAQYGGWAGGWVGAVAPDGPMVNGHKRLYTLHSGFLDLRPCARAARHPRSALRAGGTGDLAGNRAPVRRWPGRIPGRHHARFRQDIARQ